MQVVPQGHDFHRAQAAPVPVPSAPSVATAAAGADFSRPNVIFDGKRMRKPVHRRTVDYSSTVVRYIQTRMWQRDVRDAPVLQPCSAAAIDLLPTVAYPDNPATSFTTKFVHPSTNKVRCSINRVLVISPRDQYVCTYPSTSDVQHAKQQSGSAPYFF
jgi:polyadenylation factor subunit 2